MPSELKFLIAEELARRYPKGTDYIVVGYTKLEGRETSELRKTLRDSGVRLEVVKNSIAVRVLEANGLGAGAMFLQGPSALVAGEVEMPQLCKIIADCAKKLQDKLIIHGGLMGNMPLTAEGVNQLASIPPLPVLHAQILGGIQASMVGVAAAFQSLLRGLACALEGIRGLKEEGRMQSAEQ